MKKLLAVPLFIIASYLLLATIPAFFLQEGEKLSFCINKKHIYQNLRHNLALNP